MNEKKLKLAVLISGSGTNLQAIISACEKNEINAEIKIVISNQENAYGLERAKKAHLKTSVIAYQNFANRKNAEKEISKLIKENNIELIVLAGFMKILSEDFIDQFPNQIINIHPSLLPSFKGIDAQKQAYDYGVKFSGATVHFVDSGCDTGPIILQEIIKIDQNDTDETVKSKILEKEHLILPKAIDLISRKKVEISGRKVKIFD